jgi:hypothetical protein
MAGRVLTFYVIQHILPLLGSHSAGADPLQPAIWAAGQHRDNSCAAPVQPSSRTGVIAWTPMFQLQLLGAASHADSSGQQPPEKARRQHAATQPHQPGEPILDLLQAACGWAGWIVGTSSGHGRVQAVNG